MVRRLTFCAALLSALPAVSATAGEITGTEDALKCVHANIGNLSFDGLLDPVTVDVGGCVALFASPVAADTVHSGLGVPDVPVDTTAQPFEDRTELTLEQMRRIDCKLQEWLAANPKAAADTEITLTLDTVCA